MTDHTQTAASFAEGERSERTAVLADLYARFWIIAELHRQGKFSPAGSDAEAAARVEQRVICILFENWTQGLHQLPDGEAG